MSVKRYKMEVSDSVRKIRRAKKALRVMPKLQQIEVMVKAGVMTPDQADRARRKLAEMEA